MIFLWVLVGLLAVSAADLRGWARGVIVDWLPFFAMLFAYDLLRGRVGNDPLFAPHVTAADQVDEFLFSGSVPPSSPTGPLRRREFCIGTTWPPGPPI